MAGLVILLRGLEPPFDQLDVGACRPDPARRFLLEGMQDVDDLRKADGVDRAIGVADMVVDELEHTRALALPEHGRGVFAADTPKALPMSSFTASGKARKSFLDEPTQSS